jgi:hypothetical protein
MDIKRTRLEQNIAHVDSLLALDGYHGVLRAALRLAKKQMQEELLALLDESEDESEDDSVAA